MQFVISEAKFFCLLIIAVLVLFKTQILSILTKRQCNSYLYASIGVLLSVLSDFITNAQAKAVCYLLCGLCYGLVSVFLITSKKISIVIPAFIGCGGLTFITLKYGFNIATYGVILALIIVFIVEQYNKIRVDNLTKLYNRYGMDVELKEQLNQYKRDKNDSFYIIACDLDKFKQINDTWGHLEGDRALKLVADALSRVSQKFNSNVFRIGGDEFVIITDTSEEGLATDIINAIKKEFDNIDFRKDWNMEISLGTALYEGKSTIDELLNSADKKLYEAKRS